jgi:hypothetical protein
MCDNRASDEFQPGDPEIRGGDKPTDYIAEAPLPTPPTWPLRADATEDEDNLHDPE